MGKYRSVLLFCWFVTTLCTAKQEEFNSDQYSYSIAEKPDWIVSQPTPVEKIIPKGNHRAISFLLSDRQIRVEKQSQIHYQHIALSPKTEAGLDQASQIQIEFNPQFEKLTIHALDIIRNGNRLNRLQPKHIQLIQREKDIEQRLYDGIVSALIILNDVRVADIIEYSYSISGINPVFGEKHFSSFSLGWNIPVERVELRVMFPAHRKINSQSYNIDLKPEISVHDNYRRYYWFIDHSPAMYDEGDYPSWYDPYPWVQLSEYKEWKEVVDWAKPLYVFDGDLNKEIRDKITQWKKQHSDKTELTLAALKFVQDEIRYFGIELGQNSHKPHHPNEVFKKRFGDCKDKSLLLSALLNQLEIPAYPALVSNKYTKSIANWLPYPGAFDHVIVMAQVDGTNYWLDSTQTNQRGMLDTISSPDNGKALVIGYNNDTLESINVPKSSIPVIKTHEHFHIQQIDKPVQLTVTSVYTGNRAELLREYFSQHAVEKISFEYLNYYARTYPKIKRNQELTFIDDQKSNHFTVIENYLIEEFLKTEDQKRYFIVHGTSLAPFTALPRHLSRTSPLALKYPISVSHSVNISAPKELSFNLELPDETFKNKQYTYSRNAHVKNGNLNVTYSLQIVQDAVLPEELFDYISELKKTNNSLTYYGWISSPELLKQTELRTTELIEQLIDSISEYKLSTLAAEK